MERDGSKEPVPRNGIGSGPIFPRTVARLGMLPRRPATGGFSMVSAALMYAAGSKEEKQAPGPLHGGTIAQSFLFCNRVVAGA